MSCIEYKQTKPIINTSTFFLCIHWISYIYFIIRHRSQFKHNCLQLLMLKQWTYVLSRFLCLCLCVVKKAMQSMPSVKCHCYSIENITTAIDFHNRVRPTEKNVISLISRLKNYALPFLNLFLCSLRFIHFFSIHEMPKWTKSILINSSRHFAWFSLLFFRFHGSLFQNTHSDILTNWFIKRLCHVKWKMDRFLSGIPAVFPYKTYTMSMRSCMLLFSWILRKNDLPLTLTINVNHRRRKNVATFTLNTIYLCMYDVYGEADKWIKIRCTQTISIVSHLPNRNNVRNDFYRHVVNFCFALLWIDCTH